jgi:hypothetical protein
VTLDEVAMLLVMTSVIFGVQLVAYSKLLLPAYAIAGLVTYLIVLRLLKAVTKEDMSSSGDT